MSLYITTRDEVYQWHIGQVMPINIRQTIPQIISIQADCDELEFLLARFPYLSGKLPAKARVVSWYGDEAKYLIGNALYSIRTSSHDR